jgi:hypothetical protein
MCTYMKATVSLAWVSKSPEMDTLVVQSDNNVCMIVDSQSYILSEWQENTNGVATSKNVAVYKMGGALGGHGDKFST